MQGPVASVSSTTQVVAIDAIDSAGVEPARDHARTHDQRRVRDVELVGHEGTRRDARDRHFLGIHGRLLSDSRVVPECAERNVSRSNRLRWFPSIV